MSVDGEEKQKGESVVGINSSENKMSSMNEKRMGVGLLKHNTTTHMQRDVRQLLQTISKTLKTTNQHTKQAACVIFETSCSRHTSASLSVQLALPNK